MNPTDGQLRAEFEAWGHDKLSFVRDGERYLSVTAQCSWQAYRAAHASGYRAGLERAKEICEKMKTHVGYYRVPTLDEFGAACKSCADAIQGEIDDA